MATWSTVREAVLWELDQLPEDLQKTTQAALALSLAAQMDNPSTSMAVAPVAKELRECIDGLWQRKPVDGDGDSVDELSAAREQRRRELAAGE